ncbi:Ankyrin repeat [Diplonema papillatum]|nr:Ankyrin repeat [Diplonema papillatum]|eukprot:gene1792-2724_t
MSQSSFSGGVSDGDSLPSSCALELSITVAVENGLPRQRWVLAIEETETLSCLKARIQAESRLPLRACELLARRPPGSDGLSFSDCGISRSSSDSSFPRSPVENQPLPPLDLTHLPGATTLRELGFHDWQTIIVRRCPSKIAALPPSAHLRLGLNHVNALDAAAKELMTAVRDGNLPKIAELHRAGVDLAKGVGSARRFNGVTPLKEAVAAGRPGSVRELLQRGVDVDTVDVYRVTALHIAVSKEDVAVVNVLVGEFGARVDLEDQMGNTPLHLACESGAGAVVAALLKHAGGSLRRAFTMVNCNGRTPLHLAVANSVRRPSCAAVVSMLLDAGANSTERPAAKCNPLHCYTQLALRPAVAVPLL